MVALRGKKWYILKQARYVTLPDHGRSIFFEILAKTVEKRDVIGVVRLSCNLPLMLHVCSPFCGPTLAFTTLLTQCTPYLRPVPTVLPTTFTNPSLPHSPEVP